MHLLRVKHDATSHEFDCHDECVAEVVCPGVTADCRTWWSCTECDRATAAMSADEVAEYDDDLSESGEAHGVQHQRIDGMWMTPGHTCLAYSLENDADEVAFHSGEALPDGEHAVDLDCSDGFVYLLTAPPTEPQP